MLVNRFLNLKVLTYKNSLRVNLMRPLPRRGIISRIRRPAAEVLTPVRLTVNRVIMANAVPHNTGVEVDVVEG